MHARQATAARFFFFFVYVSDRRFSVAHKWNSTNIFTEYFCTKIAWPSVHESCHCRTHRVRYNKTNIFLIDLASEKIKIKKMFDCIQSK